LFQTTIPGIGNGGVNASGGPQLQWAPGIQKRWATCHVCFDVAMTWLKKTTNSSVRYAFFMLLPSTVIPVRIWRSRWDAGLLLLCFRPDGGLVVPHEQSCCVSDPMVDSWFLMSSPMPILSILGFYLYFVLKLGPQLMATRKAFNLQGILVAYNFYQVLFSLWLCTMVRYCTSHSSHTATNSCKMRTLASPCRRVRLSVCM
jgi:hypothetical protein